MQGGISLDLGVEDFKSAATLRGNIFNENKRSKGTQLFKKSSYKGLSGHSLSRHDNQVSPLGVI